MGGFRNNEWKGSFYPEDLKPADMLAYYAQRPAAVEINNSFHRTPTKSLLQGWASQAPDAFRFVPKVARKVTHFKRLKNVNAEVAYLVKTVAVMGDRLGAPRCSFRPTSPATPPGWRPSSRCCLQECAQRPRCGILLRLRRCSYTAARLREWAKRIASQGRREAFVFFKHEQIGFDLARKPAAAAGA